MAKTKIIVIQMKEIIYTALFIGIGIFLIILLIFLFRPKSGNDAETQESSVTYNAGTYNSQIMLGSTSLNLEVTVDPDYIKSVRLVNISSSVTTMFPLLEPALEQIEDQLVREQNLNGIEISDSSRYTQTLLIEAIGELLKKARSTPDTGKSDIIDGISGADANSQ